MNFAIRHRSGSIFIDAPSWFVAREYARKYPDATLVATEPPEGAEVVEVRGAPTEQDVRDDIRASIRRAVWREALELFEDSVSDRELRAEFMRRAGLHDDHREARRGA